MFTQIENFDLTQILEPVQQPQDARTDAVQWGPSLSITKGQTIAIKTSDNRAYAYAGTAGTGGLGVFKGFAKYTLTTDTNGAVYLGSAVGSGTNATPSLRLGPTMSAPIYIAGIFAPADLDQTYGTSLVDLHTGKPGASILHNGFVKID
jgi:hypothetical protein